MQNMDSFWSVVLALALLLCGFLIAGICALFWRRYRLLHIVPIVYPMLIYLLLYRVDAVPWDWRVPVLFSALSYGVAWLPVLYDKESGLRKPQNSDGP